MKFIIWFSVLYNLNFTQTQSDWDWTDINQWPEKFIVAGEVGHFDRVFPFTDHNLSALFENRRLFEIRWLGAT
jgi:hypothetical protein